MAHDLKMRPAGFRYLPAVCAVAICAWAGLGVAVAAGGEPPASDPGEPVDDFSAERAWSHLERLVGFGPRISGTPGAERARAYLTQQLRAVGAEVFETRLPIPGSGRDGEAAQREAVHLTGVLPGDSPDIFLLAAHYDTSPTQSFRFLGANDGASGPALLLELARRLAAAPRPYSIWISFLDAEALPRSEDDPAAGHWGSRALAERWQADAVLSHIRVAFFFNQVADADLRIARDLRSHRPYREILWEAARVLARGDAFPPTAAFEAPVSSHRAFLERGVRRVVAVVDNHFGGEQEPGFYWHTEGDTLEHCAPESLETVGVVSLDALRRIGARLAKIDRFVARAEGMGEAPAPPGSPTTGADRAPNL